MALPFSAHHPAANHMNPTHSYITYPKGVAIGYDAPLTAPALAAYLDSEEPAWDTLEFHDVDLNALPEVYVPEAPVTSQPRQAAVACLSTTDDAHAI